MKRTLHLLIVSFFAVAASAQPELKFTPVTLTGPALVQPLDITGCGDGSGRLFITEKRGTIRIIKDGEVLPDFFLNIQTQVINSGERGLLGMAFHPQFPDSPYIYVNYVIKGTIINQISRFTLNPENPNDIDESTEVKYLSQQGVETNHKAGDLAFGPDGYLYFGMGDGGGGGDPTTAGQNNETYLGKIMRIDVNTTGPSTPYGIPADNPFVDTNGLDEIWANGIRNPWRISFDRLTGDFWIADVGQNLYEEIDMIPAGTAGGMNFGWDCREGKHGYEPQNCPGNAVFVEPIFEYPHSCSPCPSGRGASLTGGFVYRGSDFPALQGYYICADYVSNYYWMIRQTGSDPLEFEAFPFNGTGLISELVSFGEDDRGEMYACNLNGKLYAVGTAGPPPTQWEDIHAEIVIGGNQIDWTVQQTTGIVDFEIQRSLTDGFDDYVIVHRLLPDQIENTYQYTDPYIQPISVYYRIVANREDATKATSPVVRTIADPVSRPTLVLDQNTNIWRINIPDPWTYGEVTLYDLQGKEVYVRKVGADRQVDLTPPITPGCYFVKLRGKMGTWSDRVVW